METMIKKSGDFKTTTTTTLCQNNNRDTGLNNKMTVARTPEPAGSSKASSGVSSCSTTPEPMLVKADRGASSTPDDSDAGIQTKGCEVYVTRIPRHLKETDLLDVFGKIGKIADLRLMMGQTGQNKGYAYIRYGVAQDAKEAIKILNNHEISPNRHLVVTKSVDNRRLWVNGIPKSKSTAEIRRDMERLTSGVIDIILYPSQTDKTRSRGYMFVEYESHKAAAVARRKLSQGNVSVCGQEVGQVDWAEPEHEVDEETMSSVKILFVRNLMMTTSEETLRNIFNSKGNNEVERVRKTKDFAFVHFSTRSSAEQALAQSHNLVIDQAEVEVLWSKPVDKKLYNTRKTLTKAFTIGTDFMEDGNGALKALSPVKRGAAGIQGLGAPGTAPSKHLVQKYVSMTRAGGPGVAGCAPGVLPGLSGGHISPVQLGHGKMSSQPRQYPFYRSAPDLLREFCLLSNWGEPIYHYSGTEGLYLCKVTLPNLPSQPNSFQGLQYKMTAEEARLDTVQQVLDLLRIPQIYATSIANYNQMYQMTAAGQLQGIPLTLPHQQAVGDAAGGVVPPQAHPMRLQYPPEPYRSNYAYLVNSMAGMNLNMCA